MICRKKAELRELHMTRDQMTSRERVLSALRREIFASGNSIPAYTRPENLKTMADTFSTYRAYLIGIDE